ncbi:hypothetical protein HRI_002640200 [Hibiscus trionum]|uniref:Uncharacterized protein n=1 Tax=Hibiscus trionum TaxID=183268 RepID=A0A9W7I5H6_HIBTR|nr:hypothetical protein HRI_002640200 [Hibiscus trionum]
MFMRSQAPDIVVVMEPSVSGDNADNFICRSGFDHSYQVEATGLSGGIWVLWNDSVVLDVVVVSNQFIHASCSEAGSSKHFFITFVYASPNASRRSGV